MHAFIQVTADNAAKYATEIDREMGATRGALAGLPTAIKDNMVTESVTTTCGSKILGNYQPVYTATAVRRIWGDHIVMLGKTNMDEFAMGSSTENSAFGPTHNPWDLGTVPGGSVGGSAAAVAAGEALWALGSDTGGSIRQPASLCGIVGMKPTYGAVSRYGLVAFASSLDQIGPLTRTVYDCALLLRRIVGRDPCDSTLGGAARARSSCPRPSASTACASASPPSTWRPASSPACGALRTTRVALRRGARRDAASRSACRTPSTPCRPTTSSPRPRPAPTWRASTACATATARGRRRPRSSMYEATRGEGFGAEVKRRIMIGTYALSSGYYDAYYGQAQKVRTLIRRDFDTRLRRGRPDRSPTSPTVAFGLGERTDDPLAMY